jgi:uncharacterized NAD(P)/FAD-binding protein YdhS
MRIVIIGGGATGALTAIHLAHRLPYAAAEIVIVESSAQIGRGLAYATADSGHLLNVRAANMSAFPDQPEQFHHWLQFNGPRLGIGCPTGFCFVPRGVYGAYIAELAEQAVSSGAVSLYWDRCVDLAETPDGVSVQLESGESLQADQVILATGNDAKPALAGIPAAPPWGETTLAELDLDAPILILGTGLTMVDMVLSLNRRGHRGRVIALSRHGFLPSPHRPAAAYAISADTVPFGASLSEVMAWLRAQAEAAIRQGADWRSAVDAIRPYTRDLWQSMTLEEKRRFLRHVRAFWDVHRHRMAPAAAVMIDNLVAAGRLEVIAGRVVSAEQRDGEIQIQFRRRRKTQIESLAVARLIDCTGLADNPARSANPLIRALLASGRARIDRLGIGLDIANTYALVDAQGRPSGRISAIGPLARAAFWESVAIPDIRLQCRDVADAMHRLISERIPPHDAAPARLVAVEQLFTPE